MNAVVGSYLLATLAFILVSAVVGARLVLLSRRTGQRPERYLGLGILGTAVLGYGFQIASTIVRGGPDGMSEATPLALGLTAAGKVLHDAGLTLVLLFVLTVFRRDDPSARMLFGVAVATLWIGMIGSGVTGGWRDLLQRDLFWWMEYAVIWTYPLWGAWESFRYHARMRKRVRLGLAEPLVANRFLLWALASLGTFTATWLASWPMLLPDPRAAAAWQDLNYLATAAVGICTVVAYLLAFLPPRGYRRWIASRAPGGAAAEAA